MRFLADENLDFAVVRALRSAGHEVRALAEETSRTADADVIALARREGRILLTEDKDFGCRPATRQRPASWRSRIPSPYVTSSLQPR